MKYKKLSIIFTIEVTPENIGLVRRLNPDAELGQDADIEYNINAIDNTNYSDLIKPVVCLFNNGKFETKPRLIVN